MDRYPPLKVTDYGNDDVAISRSSALLKEELERSAPRKSAVLSLVKQTYPSRREFILSDVSVSSILEMHKELTLSYSVSNIVHFKKCETESELNWIWGFQSFVWEKLVFVV